MKYNIYHFYDVFLNYDYIRLYMFDNEIKCLNIKKMYRKLKQAKSYDSGHSFENILHTKR